MGDKPISSEMRMVISFLPQMFGNEKKLEELFNRLNPNRALRFNELKKKIHLSKLI